MADKKAKSTEKVTLRLQKAEALTAELAAKGYARRNLVAPVKLASVMSAVYLLIARGGWFRLKNGYVVDMHTSMLALIVPAVVSVCGNIPLLLYLSIFNIMGAGGDLSIIFKMLADRSSASEVIAMDHPSECGCILFEK